MARRGLTIQQRATLAILRGDPMTTAEVRDALNITTDAAHTRLRNLEDKMWVRRTQLHFREIIQWELTGQGRKALETSAY